MPSTTKRNKSNLISFQVHTSYLGPQLAFSRAPVNVKDGE